MTEKFTIEKHTTTDKDFQITGGESLSMRVDFDDVDHKTVDKEAKKMVKILNDNWDKKDNTVKILEELEAISDLSQVLRNQMGPRNDDKVQGRINTIRKLLLSKKEKEKPEESYNMKINRCPFREDGAKCSRANKGEPMYFTCHSCRVAAEYEEAYG